MVLDKTTRRNLAVIRENGIFFGLKNEVRFMGLVFYSDDMKRTEEEERYDTDKNVCVEYLNKKQHIKPGKLFQKLIKETNTIIPYRDRIHLMEEMTNEFIGSRAEVELYVNKNFAEAYSAKNSKVFSCMSNVKDFEAYQNDVMEVMVAYLKKPSGMIVARALIFPKVFDMNGNKYRLCDRQYYASTTYQKRLLNELFDRQYIEAYRLSQKKIFVNRDGCSLPTLLYIRFNSKAAGNHRRWMDTFTIWEYNKLCTEPIKVGVNDIVYLFFVLLLFSLACYLIWQMFEWLFQWLMSVIL